MNALTIVKGITTTIVSIGAGAVVENAIKATTPADIRNAKRIALAVGGFAISSMVAEAATGYVKEKIDDVVTAFKEEKVHVITDVQEN